MRSLPPRSKALALRRAALIAALTLAGCDATLEPILDAGPLPPDAQALDAALARDAAPPRDAGPPRDAQVFRPDAAPPEPPLEDPEDIFFVGNSFTFGGPIPTMVEELAIEAGHLAPHVEYRAVPGQTLAFHRADTDLEGAPTRVAEGWDVVVLQENSLRPTDALGDPEQFKEDATWFHDLARTAEPSCRVVLYETWARRAGHSVYTSAFDDPADMQEQLRFHYYDAAGHYIPTFTTLAGLPDVHVAPAGDAWELQLAGGEPPRLHADDDWHAGAAGQYLNALVIYATIYGRRTRGLPPIRVDAATAALLQATADAITGAERDPPFVEAPEPIAIGASVRADVGPTASAWASLTANGARAGPVTTVDGAPTAVRFSVSGFSGVQTGGSAVNELGWPAEVSSDSLWVGSFDGHAAALALEGTLAISGLPPGAYRVELFASRDGTDGAMGRLSRYRIGDLSLDLDAADNTGRLARFDGVRPSAFGDLAVRVAVSPDGGARFAYLGAVVVTRTGE